MKETKNMMQQYLDWSSKTLPLDNLMEDIKPNVLQKEVHVRRWRKILQKKKFRFVDLDQLKLRYQRLNR